MATLVIKLLLLYLFTIVVESQETSTFIVSFQSGRSRSIEQWMKYNEKFEGYEKEFTACHWQRVRYFSMEMNSIWAYCYAGLTKESSQLPCIQFYFQTNETSAGRAMNFVLVLMHGSSENRAIAYSMLYHHREWNHLCVIFSSVHKRVRFFHNGELVQTIHNDNFEEMWYGQQINESSFIVGQEPDTVNGGFNPVQLFNGEIANLNIWDKPIDEMDVRSMAECRLNLKGNLIAWEKEKFTINKAKVQNVNQIDTFCNTERKVIVFTERYPFKKAEKFCGVHGGSLITPSSDNDVKRLIKILEMHRASCLDSDDILNNGKAFWLGMKRRNRDWLRVGSNGHFHPINYTNWDPDSCTARSCGADGVTSCPYMNADGFWAFGLKIESCLSIALCPVCEFEHTPVFSLNGLCSETSPIDWNYYIRTDETFEIVGYDGYKTSDLSKVNGQWFLWHPAVHANTSGDHPLGRKNWSYIDSTCEMKIAENTSLKLSVCFPGKEFTCDSGECVPLIHRCNQINDCEDKSDEKHCNLIDVPPSYDKLIAPGTYGRKREKAVGIRVKVKIKAIDTIDVKKMQIGLSFLIFFRWKDERLQFHSLGSGGNNLISDVMANKIWLPSENLIFVNSIIGKVIEGQNSLLRAENLTNGELDLTTKSIESYLYPGSKTMLHQRVAYKIINRCNFWMTKFPFDQHECQFDLGIQVWRNNSITFVDEPNAIIYNAESTWNDFQIHDQRYEILNDMKRTTFTFSLRMTRLYMNQMLNTFLPTVLLWSLAYFTLFIEIENFSDRFIGTVTTLLVLVALLNSTNGDLPKTSYFKFIDLWFLWFISSILFTTLFHILISYVSRRHSIKLAIRINQVGILLFAIAMGLFIVFYCSLTI